MIKLERDPLHVKSEVTRMIQVMNEGSFIPNENLQRGIVKRVIFLKILLSNKKPSHYPMSLLYDSLSGLYSLFNLAPRYFHFNFRSLIENTLRTILNLEDNDAKGVNELFNCSREFFSGNKIIIEIIDLLAGKYTLSSNYVHSNISSNMEVHLYYKRICERKTANEEVTGLLELYDMTLSKISELFALVFADDVQHIFHRKKTTLNYLINLENIQIYY